MRDEGSRTPSTSAPRRRSNLSPGQPGSRRGGFPSRTTVRLHSTNCRPSRRQLRPPYGAEASCWSTVRPVSSVRRLRPAPSSLAWGGPSLTRTVPSIACVLERALPMPSWRHCTRSSIPAAPPSALGHLADVTPRPSPDLKLRSRRGAAPARRRGRAPTAWRHRGIRRQLPMPAAHRCLAHPPPSPHSPRLGSRM